MSRLSSQAAEKSAVMAVATLMAVAARTAPKTRGLDSIRTLIVDGEDLEPLAAAMEAKKVQKVNAISAFGRDAGSVRNCAAVLLIGVTGEPKRPQDPLNCGACGYQTCAEFIAGEKNEGEDFRGPLCAYQSMDLGIALGAAVKVASELCVDNRIMYTLGAAARRIGLLDSDLVIGIPLSVSGKNPFFDR